MRGEGVDGWELVYTIKRIFEWGITIGIVCVILIAILLVIAVVERLTEEDDDDEQ